MKGLLQSIKASFSRELVGHLAARLGEGENSVSKALGGLVPVMLSGLIAQAGAGGGTPVFERSQRAYLAVQSSLNSVTGMLEIMGGSQAPGGVLGQEGELREGLFDNSSGCLTSSISQYAGIRVEAATALIGMVGAVLPALLGQYAATHHLTAGSTATGLASLKRPVRNMVPESLRGLADCIRPPKQESAAAKYGLGRCRLHALGWRARASVRAGVGWWWRFLPVLVGLVGLA